MRYGDSLKEVNGLKECLEDKECFVIDYHTNEAYNATQVIKREPSESFSVLIELPPTEASEVNETKLYDILAELGESYGINGNDYYIKTEINDDGKVVCIIIVTKDENTAEGFVVEVSKIVEESSDECNQDILCRATDVHIKGSRTSLLSIEEGHRNMYIAIYHFFLFFFILFH